MSEKYDDDLRDFLENYVKKEEPEEAGKEKADDKRAFKHKDEADVDRLKNMLDVSIDVGKLKERVEDLEVLNYSLWLMLKQKGFTDEEYDAAIKQAREIILAKHTLKNDAIACPKCGKLLQQAEVFGIKCIYCGYEQIANPYKAATPKDEVADELPLEFEAYDVTKDLGFDEEL